MAEDVKAELGRVDPNVHQAPVNISMADTVPIPMSDLNYTNYDITPSKMKLNNTGYTVTVSGKFEDGRGPMISGGPLDATYKFSQLHFHWGPTDSEGSEHTFEGRSVPLEMHVVHVNQTYETQEEALLQKDGVVILTFQFISGSRNAGLDGLVRGLPEVKEPQTSYKITPQALSSVGVPFQRDYFVYLGSVISPTCSHLIQWLVSRVPLQASPDQFAAFRNLLNIHKEPLLRNYRDPQELFGRTVFHCAPGDRSGFTLHCSLSATTVAPAPGEGAARSGGSLLSVEGACTSLQEADSHAKVTGSDKDVSSPDAMRAEPDAEVSAERSLDTSQPVALDVSAEAEPIYTPSGHIITRTPPDAELSPSGHQVETTPSGRLVQRTESGRELERTESGHWVEKTPSGRIIERTASGRLVERTSSGRWVERTASGRLVERTPSGRWRERTPSGREMERSPSGRETERTPSGQVIERSPPGDEKERSPSAKTRSRSSSPRSAPGHLSRAISFSNITAIKDRTGNEWPDTAYIGSTLSSPVFLDVNDAVRMKFPPLKFEGHFQRGVGLVLTNSGETVEISLLTSSERPVLSGGPLQGKYLLDSAHFHWLPNDDAQGGTHTINNARCEVECHLVHVHENYKSKTEAMEHPNGLAVCTILHQVGGEECEAFKRLCQELPRINELYTQVQLPSMDLSYMSAVVRPHNYFTYPGRFFGRDDGKGAVWIVFPQPVGICCQNVAAFQRLTLSKNFRQHDTYALGDRPLIAVIDDGSSPQSLGEGERAKSEQTPEEEDEGYAVGDTRRTASGRLRELGADEWPSKPFASKFGILMAPLDIKTSTVPSVPMPPLEYRGHFPGKPVPCEMVNTGEAVDVKWKVEGPMPTLVGGPLTEEYEFDSAHFHWAQNPDDVGAMHRVNSKRYDLECHMVHFKKSLGTRQDAMYEHDGLAVSSFLIQVGGTENESFSRLTEALPRVTKVDATTTLDINLDWLEHRAGPHGFFTYPGSLFGADQGINVIWIVYPTPVMICCQHVGQFYKLESRDYDKMHPLYEPQDRPLYYSISPDNCTA